MITCSKKFTGFPFAHRQPTHDGHCAYIHGHNWDFEFEFSAESQDANGFVIDFGELKWLKGWLEDKFDHTLVLNETDPALEQLRDALDMIEPPISFARIITVPNCGAEGLALFLHMEINGYLGRHIIARDRKVRVHRVTVWESASNSATFIG